MARHGQSCAGATEEIGWRTRMRLLRRRDEKPAADRPRDLAADARAMRAALAELHAGQQAVHGAGSPVRLRDIVNGHAAVDVVHVHVERHCSPSISGGRTVAPHAAPVT